MTGPAVLHVLPRFVGGGPERSVVTLASAMAVAGGGPTTLAVLEPPLAPTLVVRARRAGLDLVPRPTDDDLVALAASADVVVVHTWNHPVLLDRLRTVPLPPGRVLGWAHVLGRRAPQVLTADLGRYVDGLVLTAARSRATAAAETVAAAGGPVRVVPTATEPGRLAGVVPAGDGRTVGYLGVVNDAKMHPDFAGLCAAVRTPDAHFEVWGGGGGEAALTHRLAAAGLGGRARVHGPTEEVGAALAAMDVFGYPLAEDTYATSERALQEAMWLGIPPVVLPHGGVADLVEDGVTGLVATGPAGYGAAVDRLLGDPDLRARLGAAAARWVRDAFDPERWVAAARAAIEEVAARPRRERPLLAGGGGSAAEGFVAALGDQAGPFAVSVDPAAGAAAWAVADAEIAAASPLLARGEGGIVHHRNAAPDDPHLRLWSGLVAAAAGQHELAAAEYGAAEALGLGDDRPRRLRAQLPGAGSPPPS